jgi:hypothetical protein
MRAILAAADRIEQFLDVLACEAFFGFAALNAPLLDDAEVPIPSSTRASDKG